MAITRVTLDELKNHLAATPQPRTIDEVILHHTWSPTAAQYRGPSTWESIRRYHMSPTKKLKGTCPYCGAKGFRRWLNRKGWVCLSCKCSGSYGRGWSGIGYHIGAGPDDSIWLLRPIERSGAHTLNHNAHSIGVCMVGNFDEEDPEANGLFVAGEVCAAICNAYTLGASAIHYHREYANKSCPGNRIYDGDIRRMVEAHLAGAGGGISPYAQPAIDWALEEGLLEGRPGEPINGSEPVTLERLMVFLHRLEQR